MSFSATVAEMGEKTVKKSGMPQMDITTFPTQIFWLFVIFAAIYLFISFSAAPKIAETLEKRQNRIESDLAEAEKLQAEADAERGAFEKALDESRAFATATIADKRAAIKADIEAEYKKLTDKLNSDAAAAEKRILDAKEEALKEVTAAASDVCKDMVAKISGLDISDKDVAKAVDQSMNTLVKGNS
jgi:F-type H+-transporting ATPase subunit b